MRAPWRSTTNRHSFLVSRVVLVAALLALLAPTLPLGPANPGAMANGDPATLYVGKDWEAQTFVPVDPETLSERTDLEPLDFDHPYPDWALSGDGSTMVQIDYPITEPLLTNDEITIIVRDGIDGPERLRFHPPEVAFGARLTRDGSRLLLSQVQNCNPSGCNTPVWHVFDTANGELITTITGDGYEVGPWGGLLDPAGRRLYRATIGGEGQGFRPLHVVAHDLSTGAEVGKVTLSDVRAGSTFSQSEEEGPVTDRLGPAVALSADGEEIAVVSAETDVLTVIDTATMTVERATAMTTPRTLGDRLLDWFSVAPRSAAAKYMIGREMSAVFAPDGQSVYIFGSEGEVNAETEESGDYIQRGLGVKRVDLTTGEIVAESLDGDQVMELLVAPDGSAVYAMGPTVPWMMASSPPRLRLSRLDGQTLDVLVDREFSQRHRFVLVPDRTSYGVAEGE